MIYYDAVENSSSSTLLVSEIFSSVQGEGPWAGQPCTFIRLAGCPWGCAYCDTNYARLHPGRVMLHDDILMSVREYPWQLVELTGGEPLHQPSSPGLMQELLQHGYRVMLETSGLNSLDGVPGEVMIIMDIKTPGSGLGKPFLPENLDRLTERDSVKFVICDRSDFEWAVQKVKTLGLLSRCPVYFSPSYHQVSNRELAEWILREELPVRLNLQIHKILWGEKPGC